MSENLKPCPFCGGEAELVTNINFDAVWAECKSDGCGCEIVGKRTKMDAIDNWNTRTQETK